MIDKLTPKFLDKSSDYKLVRKTSLIDALNIYVDVETGGEDTGGVIKPIKGNLGIPTSDFDEQFSEDVNYKAIGSVTDEVTGIVYFFVWSEDPLEHGVWAYDHRGVLPQYDSNNEEFFPGQKKRVRKIISAPEFNFPVNGFVKGDIVYSNTREFEKYDQLRDLPYPEKDAILYFTDNVNEPRKINIYRALLSGYPSLGTQARKDFISACPRVPLDRPSFEFVADQDRDINNFAASPGFQFAYQNIYADGLESSISPYSSMAFPPSIVNRGAISSDQILAHNKCLITIPSQNEEVESIKILARYGNGVNFIEIDEVQNTPGEDIVFEFYNDRISSGVSPQTVDKTFDNIPQRAQAQTVASNRLVYGNYVEGYDNVDCSGVELTPEFLERPTEILDYYLKVYPSIEICGGGSQDASTSNHKTPNKTMGFSYRTDEFADFIPANTKIIISFSFTPDKNFHFYNVGDVTHSSYHQSRQVGSFSANLPGYNEDEVVENSLAYFQDNDGYSEPGYLNDAAAGGYFLLENQENYFGFTKGLSGNSGDDPVRWKQTLATNQQALSSSGERDIAFGTSAGNPLIIVGGKLSFKVEFTVVNEVATGGSTFISDVFGKLLEGRDQAHLDDVFGEGAVTFNPEDIKRNHVHEFDVGLQQDYTPIATQSQLGSLICGAGRCVSSDYSTIKAELEDKPPSCAFIVNKGKVGFYLQRSTERTSGMHRAFSIGVGYITVDSEDDVWTCIRDIDPRSPWWAISKSRMTNEIVSQPLIEWENNLDVPNRVYRRLAGTDADSMTRNFAMAFDGINGAPDRKVMEMCFGHLRVNPDAEGRLNLLTFYRDIDDVHVSDEPLMPISLQDGEGGPGGEGAGDGTAYDILQCHKLGSIAGQAFVGVDYDAIEKTKLSGQQFLVSSLDDDPTGLASTNTGDRFSYVVDQTVADQLNLTQNTGNNNNLVSLGLYEHDSIFMGPYYTGKIVLNNIQVPSDVGNVNPTPLPVPGENNRHCGFTTTLPLVMFSSWARFDESTPSGGGGSEMGQDPLIAADPDLYSSLSQDNFYNDGELQVSYPYPIVQTQNEGGGSIIDGDPVSGTLVENPFGTGYNSVDFEKLQSHAELSGSVTSYNPESNSSLSFKTNATHEIGMVYYDERGRHGRVNPIGSLYIPGYGERNSAPKGRSLIRVSNITHRPPSWAKKYKFVYTKNTSIDKFIQYSAGGAFVTSSDYEGGSPTSIYVSLNYLQGHPISYSDAFGARGKDNTPVMYSFTPGDRLRVISYMLTQENEQISRIYPVEAEFEVTGLTSFDQSLAPADHPFAEINAAGEFEVTEDKNGLFLILKNNNDAGGFRYQDIEQGSDNWGNNCIFEIYSPVKEVDREDRLYYEIGEAYDVVYATAPEGHPEAGQLQMYHDFESVLLEEGDVYFRRHAVNFREFTADQGFVDMIGQVDDEGLTIPAESNFKSYYLESEAATDLFPSRVTSIGRPNIIDLDARRSVRESSIIHSDRDIVEARKIGYSSFNRTIPSDLEIDTRAGAINYLTNHQDSLFFIQKNKCGHIPVDRTLISDTSGTASLIASSKFLGTPRYYVGEVGCDDNPESVVSINNAAYFANKSTGKVFKVSGANGVNVISDKGVSEYLRNQFNAATSIASSGVRVVGGYDPLKKEYLLSIMANKFDSSLGSYNDLTVTDNWSPSFDQDDTIYYAVDEGEQLFPAIQVDWNKPSNLNDGNWSIFYDSVVDSDSGNINGINSQWRPRPDGTAYPLTVEAELEIKFINAGSFIGSPNITLELGRLSGLEDSTFTPDAVSANWYTGELDSAEFSATGDVINQLNLKGNGHTWHFGNLSEGVEYNDYSDGPFSVTATLNPGQHAEDATVIRKVGIRFMCSPSNDSADWYNIINPLELPNLEDVSAEFLGVIKVSSTKPFTKGSDGELVNEHYVGLTGNVYATAIEGQEGVVVGLDTSGYEDYGIGPLTNFNACNPLHGIFDQVDDEGILTSGYAWSTMSGLADNSYGGGAFARVRNWIDKEWGAGTFNSLVGYKTLLAIQVKDQLEEIYGNGTSGLPSCVNINYTAYEEFINQNEASDL